MNAFWVGVLVAMILSAVAPGWVKLLTTAAAVVFSGLLMRLPKHPHGHIHLVMPSWLVAVCGIAFGLWAWHYARRRGLEHLGKAELRNRWNNVRNISKWGW